jgi:hypothetical protein
MLNLQEIPLFTVYIASLSLQAKKNEDLTNSSIVSKGKRICVETRKLHELVLRMHVPHLSSKLSLQAEKAKDFDFSWWLNRRRSK